MDKVFAFEWCYCIYESGYSVMSLHKTRKGAYLAKKKYMIKEEEQYRNRWRFRNGRKERGDRFNSPLDKPFVHERGRIVPIVVKD